MPLKVNKDAFDTHLKIIGDREAYHTFACETGLNKAGDKYVCVEEKKSR